MYVKLFCSFICNVSIEAFYQYNSASIAFSIFHISKRCKTSVDNVLLLNFLLSLSLPFSHLYFTILQNPQRLPTIIYDMAWNPLKLIF